MTEEAHSSTHPPLPPTTEDLWYSRLRLLRSRQVGPVSFHRLLAEHGSAQNALEALPKMARTAGMRGYEICPTRAVDTEVKLAKAAKARLLCFDDPLYPAPLSQLGNAPPLLWARGDLSLLCRPMIAIVGARNASSLGTRMARALAQQLGERGFTIVSGLARGIDTAAHHAALETGTIAVVAGGCDVTYPAENAALSDSIIKQGLCLSERPMGHLPKARDFPKRNRIIAGLAQAVIVVEAAARSGSLITARDALDLGREVLAVPGHPFDARASGCNMLIRDGAQLVRNADDVIAALPPQPIACDKATTSTGQQRAAQTGLRNIPAVDPACSSSPPASATAPTVLPPTALPLPVDEPSAHELMKMIPKPAPQKRSLRETAALHQQILNRLGPSPAPADQIMRELDISPRWFSPAVTELELEGKIARLPGGQLSLTPDKDHQ